MTTTPVISEYAAAGLVVRLRIEDEQLPSWQGAASRSGTLGVRVLETFKGAVAANGVVQLPVVEHGGGGLVFDSYGIWAQVPTVPGTELVAFCDGTDPDLASQVSDEHCSYLVPAEVVLADLRLLQRLRPLTADQWLVEADRVRADAGALFARCVWVQVREAVVTDADRFNLLMRIAENGETATEAQDAYLLAAYEDATVTGDLPTPSRARLVRAMFRAAFDPGSSALHERLVETFIPNLLQAPAPIGVPEVFADQRELAERIRSEQLPGVLRDWIGGA
ncbi:hypothetical protein AB0P21_33395 [Kribbella sp. NPDC056861]|uniref:hypothetical protein n=1 Tax=Kribbella sp. NPDC056861 TaxID=3154857 RepID=UPI003415AA44